MPKTGPYDELVARKEDGYSMDIWDSDSDEGRKRIREREAAANAPRRAGGVSRKEFEDLARYLGKRFAEERQKLHLDIREQLADARTELAGLLASAVKVEREIEKMKKQAPRVVGGKDAA